VIVCYSRCLYCGRRTPHEVCHEHWASPPEGDDREFQEVLDALWAESYSAEPELCDSPTCPQANT